MSTLAPSLWDRIFSRFQCRKCSGIQAYRSRPRGFFERHFLPLLLLKPVRCEQCYHRAYVFRTVAALERASISGKPPQGEAAGISASGERIA